jgi:hypothetical protein
MVLNIPGSNMVFQRTIAGMLHQLRNTSMDLSMNLSASTVKPWVTGSEIVPITLLIKGREPSKVYSIYKVIDVLQPSGLD